VKLFFYKSEKINKDLIGERILIFVDHKQKRSGTGRLLEFLY